jgi:RHS repeat-associated protein
VLQSTYKYDFAGRQAVRTTTSPAVTIHSVFDSQGRRIAEYNEGTGALIREYVWLGWEPIAVIEGGVTSLVRTDHIGRPVFATNTTGGKVWTASYTPFGGVRTVTGTPVNARFPGQWFQAESGLHQNWMRDYDPTTGRYLEADPLGLVDGASVYGYAGQSPMMSTDPRGEYAWTWPAIRYVVGGVLRGIGRFLGRAGLAAGAAATATDNPFPDPVPPEPFFKPPVPEPPQDACDGPCSESVLQRVRDAKVGTGALGSCKGTDDQSTLFLKLSAWAEECSARKQRDRLCISTMPTGRATVQGEVDARGQACGNMAKCMRFLRGG